MATKNGAGDFVLGDGSIIDAADSNRCYYITVNKKKVFKNRAEILRSLTQAQWNNLMSPESKSTFLDVMAQFLSSPDGAAVHQGAGQGTFYLPSHNQGKLLYMSNAISFFTKMQEHKEAKIGADGQPVLGNNGKPGMARTSITRSHGAAAFGLLFQAGSGEFKEELRQFNLVASNGKMRKIDVTFEETVELFAIFESVSDEHPDLVLGAKLVKALTIVQSMLPNVLEDACIEDFYKWLHRFFKSDVDFAHFAIRGNQVELSQFFLKLPGTSLKKETKRCCSVGPRD
jgi:hypothetical protein